MSKFVAALKRTLVGGYEEPTPHFHQGTTPAFPEVCFDDGCGRPQL
jgi:hypothetical protein